MPNFVKLLVGRDPCQPQIDRSKEYRPSIFPAFRESFKDCYNVLTPSICSFPTQILKVRATISQEGIDLNEDAIEVGCTIVPRPIWPLLINYVVLDFMKNKWIEHPLDR